MKKINSSFQTKLFLNISIVIISIICICTACISYVLYKNLIYENQASQEQITTTTSQLIDKLVDDMDNLALFISTNPNVTNAFSTLKFDDTIPDSQSYLSNTVMDTLTSVTIPNSSTRFRINLFNQKGNFLTTGIPVNLKLLNEHRSSPDYVSWYASLPVKTSKPSINAPEKDYLTSSDKKYISLYREIFHPSLIDFSVGTVEIQCPENLFLNILDESSAYSYLILGSDGKSIFSNTEGSEITSDPGDYIITDMTLDCGYKLYVYQSKNELYHIIFPFVFGIILISLALLSLMTYVIYIITKHTTQPLCQLTEQIEKVTFENLKIDPPASTGINELDKLYNAFSHMFKRLTKSIDDNMKIRSCELRANLIALQSQMNPHFLYNTLAIIKAMGKENNTKQICNICDYLSKMLRYTSSHDQALVSLNTELEHAELYLKLMKIRYEDLFEYDIDIQPGMDLSTKKIIKLSIQPILENCFQHGFKKVLPVWKIHIKCWQTDTLWFISVSDNGYGISSNQIDALEKRVMDFISNPSNSISELSIGGMGLVNTISRLKLYFKDQFTFKITKSEPCGTKIQLGGMNYDEPNDR